MTGDVIALTRPAVAVAVQLVTLTLLAGVVTALAAFVFRARVRDALPEGPTLILGLGTVAVLLNTRLVFVQFLGGTGEILSTTEAIRNVATFVTAGFASYGGRYVGDRAATSDRFTWARLQPDFSPLVRATGRVITVTLSEDIEDIEGYDPVDQETKTALAGRTIDFPRGLTVTDLQSQLVARIKDEHDVGHVDVDVTEDGTVEYLALGQRVAGLGPTVPPKSVAVAVRADPPFAATAGDTVQLWETDSEGEERRVGTGELRASVGRVVTLVTDEHVAEALDLTQEYRLMTLSADSHPDREFAAMLRRSAETMSLVTVGADSQLVGAPVGSLDVTVVAVRSADDEVETIPQRDRRIQSGDALFALGRPDALRKLEAMTAVQVTDGVDEGYAGDANVLGDA